MISAWQTTDNNFPPKHMNKVIVASNFNSLLLPFDFTYLWISFFFLQNLLVFFSHLCFSVDFWRCTKFYPRSKFEMISLKTLNKASFQMQGIFVIHILACCQVFIFYRRISKNLKSKLDLINNYSLPVLPYNWKHRIINEGMITKTLGCNLYLTFFIKHPKYYI